MKLQEFTVSGSCGHVLRQLEILLAGNADYQVTVKEIDEDLETNQRKENHEDK